MKNALWFWLLMLALVASGPACSDDDDDDDDVTSADDDDDAADDDDDPIDIGVPPQCHPLRTSEECILPYPSSFYQVGDSATASGMRFNYPGNALAEINGEAPFDVNALNVYDGAPAIGPILLHFESGVDETQLNHWRDIGRSLEPDFPILLIDMETDEKVPFFSEMDHNIRDGYEGRYALIIRPMVPMEMGHRHLVAVRDSLTDPDGGALPVSLGFHALRDGIPTTHPWIEASRDHYEDLFGILGNHGVERGELVVAWDFMVASREMVLGSILSAREQAMAYVDANGINYTIEENVADPNEYLSRMVKGTFEVPNFLDATNSFVYDGNHHPIRQGTQSFPFTLILPRTAVTGGEPVPIGLFGHGLFGSGRDYLDRGLGSTIQPIAAQAGAALIATDWIGLSGGDLEIITSQVIGSLNRITVVTDRLQQSLINNLVMTRLAVEELNSDPAIAVGDYPPFDPDRVYYFGVSLGGIQGTGLFGLSDRISRAMLSVPGSGWSNMIPRSSNWRIIKIAFDRVFPDPLLQQVGIAFTQSFFDHSDPISLARLVYREPLPDAPAERIGVWAEAIGDSQVPNLTTEMLARAVGLKQMEPYLQPAFGLETTASPTIAPVLVQYNLVDFTEDHMPPEDNVAPRTDNGAHFALNLQSNFHEQIFRMMTEGDTVQFCDGPCDPD